MKRIPRDELQRVVDAGHPDQALVGIAVGVLREILKHLPVDAIGAAELAEAGA